MWSCRRRSGRSGRSAIRGLPKSWPRRPPASRRSSFATRRPPGSADPEPRRQSLAELHFGLAPEQALGPQHAEQYQNEPDQHEAQRPHLAVAQGQMQKTQSFDHGPKEDGADGNPAVAGKSAEDQDGIAKEREGRVELAG